MDADSFSNSGDSGARGIKSNLKGWREIFVLCSKLLKWEKPYYPGIVIGIVSLLFLFIWYMDPSLVTGVSMALLIICICDYVIPFVSPMIFSESNWNSTKETEFSNACHALSDVKRSVYKSFSSLFRLKDTHPFLYVAVITVTLTTLIWLGNQMHNLMLLYFAVLIAASLPGLAHHGLLKKGSSVVGRFGKKNKD